MSRNLMQTIALAFGIAMAACSKIPRDRSAIDAVDIRSVSEIHEGDVIEKISTAATPKFLGLFRGVAYDYEVYDETVLQRDLARIERYFIGHGYLDVHARAAEVIRVSKNHVRVEIVVDAGPPTKNRGVRVDGLDGLPQPIATAIRLAAREALPAGARFDEDAYKAATVAVARALTDRGYAYANVTPNVDLDIAAHLADYTFEARQGPACTFGTIQIVGLDPDGAGPRPQEIDEKPLRRAIDIRPGTPYSTAEIDAATQALLDLGVFSSVHVVPALPDPPPASHVVPLTVQVDPTRLRQVRLGFGAEFDEIKTDLHLVTGWEDHNFLGGLRDLNITLVPGVVLFPTRLANPVVPPDVYLPEERLRVELRQPGLFEARTTGFFRPEFNIYPLLVAPNPTTTPPGYIEPKASLGVERTFWKLFTSLSYNFQVEDPFAYPGTASSVLQGLSPIVLSYPQLITNLDFRDNPSHPHAGIYLGNNLEFAGGIFGGDAEDLREQPEIRTYLPLGRRVTFATRASVGFLFPLGGYSEPQLTTTCPKNIVTNQPYQPWAFSCSGMTDTVIATPTPEELKEKADQEHDIEIVYFRGFYSGGPNTNRGFPLRGIAPFGVVPFLNPATAGAQVTNNCNPSGVNTSGCTIPIAGLTLWELSNEVRFQVSGPFSASLFCDMGDVSPNERDIRLTHLHMSVGAGARYDTPVGPIRLDVGYRIKPLQVLPYRNETDANTADPSNGKQPLFLGAPLAIAIGIGEAF
jgi:outer membrane protein insertion porin family/translocation and assembly module TamA